MNVSSEAQESGSFRRFTAILFRPIVGKALLIFLGVLPAIVLLADIRAFAVNIPFMDDWQFVPLLEKAKNGTLTFQELWAPHDEHRLLLPRIIIIVSMFATGVGGGGHFGLPPVAHGASQRKQEQRVVDMGACKHRSLLANPVPQLALADAVCLLPPLYLPRTLPLRTVCARSGAA